MGSNTLTEHVKALMPAYKDSGIPEVMRTEIRCYHDFCKRLQLPEMDPKTDELYVEITQGEFGSFKSMLAKSRGEEALRKDLQDAYKRQQTYYFDVLKPPYVEESCRKYAPSEAMIDIAEYGQRNVVDPLDDRAEGDGFFAEMDDAWAEMRAYISQIINFAFSDYYDARPEGSVTGSGILELLDEVKTYFYAVKENYKECYDSESVNPYKNIYIYMRNSFIQKFYELDLPDTNDVLIFENYDVLIDKDIYSLRDVAALYATMMNESDQTDSYYEKMKKQFQKLPYMDKFKTVDGVYEFKRNIVSIPLAGYAYYRRKNHRQQDTSDISGIDYLLSDRYAPILNAKMAGNDEGLAFYEELRAFLLKDYSDLFSSLNDFYQRFMKDYIKDSPVRLFSRISGLEKRDVYPDWPQVVEGREYS